MSRPNNAAAIGAHIQGLRELKAQFQRLPEVVRDRLNAETEWAVRRGVQTAQRNLESNPSIDTGALRDQIGWAMNWKAGRGSFGVKPATTTFRSGGKRIRIKGIVKSNAKSAQGFTKDQPSRRAHFVEFGTRKMKSEPFMLPAAEAIKAPYLARVLRSGKSIERDMSTVGGRFM